MHEFLPFRLDSVNQCLWRRHASADDERIALTPKAFAVLHYLVEHARRLVTQACIAQALSTMAGFAVPVAAWHVHATAAALYERTGNATALAQHRSLSRSTMLQLAHSLGAAEPLRTTFLSAPSVRVVLGDTESILISAEGT